MRLLLVSGFVLASTAIGLAAFHAAPRLVDQKDSETGATTLPNGWRVTPAGRTVALPGDMPMRIIPIGNGSRLLVNTAGWHDHNLDLIDVESGRLLQSLELGKDWSGMAFDAQSQTAFLSGGGPGMKEFPKLAKQYGLNENAMANIGSPLLRASVSGDQLNLHAGLAIGELPEKSRFISGVTLGPDGSLYALNINTDTVYKLSKDGSVLAKATVGYRPYAAALSPDAKTLAVSNWGDQSVSLLQAADLATRQRVVTGSHPNDLAYDRQGRLFVANAGSNTVSVVEDGAVVETIHTSIDVADPVGATPVALAVSPDGSRLYIANADNNDVAMADISHKGHSQVMGFIPTGWYPSALAVSPDGKQLFVGTAKGLTFGPNVPAATRFAHNVPDPKTPFDYIGAKLTGTVAIVDVPQGAELKRYTSQVIANRPVPERYFDRKQADAITKQAFSKVKHVLYIIRENRTYDQVLGDLGKGNGDPALAIFGEKTTPNAHKLARESVTFDNLYCDGEVSEDGHQWSDAAWASDFTQKAWVNSYSRRGEPEADERLVSSPAGYLWDNCARHHLTYRTYGEAASFVSTPDTAPIVKTRGQLDGHVSVQWLEVGRRAVRKPGFDARDTNRADVFLNELAAAEKTGDWPNFMVMSLGEDHTEGMSPGAFTPSAHVASNDLALGRIIEGVSRSKFWPETAIFVIEDDAQNGPDHVDAHRTVGFVLSPNIKRGVVDSTFYTTSSMVRTMELMLQLPPMTQFDQRATPMYAAFSMSANLTPFTHVEPQIEVLARNPEKGPDVASSRKMDFSGYDRADPDELNRVIWAGVRPGERMPAPVHGTGFIRR